MIYWLLGALGLTGSGIGVAALLGGGPATLLGAKWLWSWLSHATFLQVVCLALAGAWGVDHLALLASHRHAHKVETQLGKEVAARADDRAAYTKAQADAAAKTDAKIAAAKQKQQEISDATESRLNSRLQLIASELRKQTDAAAQRQPSGGKAGNASPAPCIANDPSWLCLSPADRLSAAENEERHDELIDWVTAQSAIDPNK